MEEPIQPTEPTQPEKPLQVTSTPIDDAPANCPECTAPAIPNKIFCNKCGYPINGTHEQKSDYEINKYVLQSELEIANKRIKNGTITLYVLAGLSLVSGLILGLISKSDEVSQSVIFILFTIIAGIFLGLALFSKKKPFAALLTALILYVTLLLMDAVADPVTIIKGIIIKVIVIIALVKGTMGAYEAEKIRKKLHID